MISRDAVGGRSIGLRRSTSGFTLLELLVSVSVTAILFATAVPTFGEMLKNSQRAATINEFVAALAFARTHAITRGDAVTVCRLDQSGSAGAACAGSSGGWQSGWLVFVDEDRDGLLDADESILRQHGPLNNGATLNGNANIMRRITFAASGVTGNNGRVAFCDSRGWTDDARIIVVSTAGRVRTLTRPQDRNDPLPGCVP